MYFFLLLLDAYYADEMCSELGVFIIMATNKLFWEVQAYTALKDAHRVCGIYKIKQKQKTHLIVTLNMIKI